MSEGLLSLSDFPELSNSCLEKTKKPSTLSKTPAAIEEEEYRERRQQRRQQKAPVTIWDWLPIDGTEKRLPIIKEEKQVRENGMVEEKREKQETRKVKSGKKKQDAGMKSCKNRNVEAYPPLSNKFDALQLEPAPSPPACYSSNQGKTKKNHDASCILNRAKSTAQNKNNNQGKKKKEKKSSYPNIRKLSGDCECKCGRHFCLECASDSLHTVCPCNRESSPGDVAESCRRNGQSMKVATNRKKKQVCKVVGGRRNFVRAKPMSRSLHGHKSGITTSDTDRTRAANLKRKESFTTSPFTSPDPVRTKAANKRRAAAELNDHRRMKSRMTKGRKFGRRGSMDFLDDSINSMNQHFWGKTPDTISGSAAHGCQYGSGPRTGN